MISFILPTLGRPEGLQRCLNSIQNLTISRDQVEILVLDGEGTVPEKIDKGLKQVKGDYLVYAANDMEFESESVAIALKESINRRKGLVSFNEGPLLPDKGNICTHFLISRE